MNLTTYLTTIAVVTATIVAILAGFIYSKHISISNERASARERVAGLEEEKRIHEAKRKTLQEYDEEGEAVNFTADHIGELMDGKDFDSVYDGEKNPEVEKDRMSSYWAKAVDVWNRYRQLTEEQIEDYDFHGVPMVLCEEFEDYFPSSVCEMIVCETRRREDEEYYKTHELDPMRLVPPSPMMPEYWCPKRKEKIYRHAARIERLDAQIKIITDNMESVSNTKKLKKGLVIIAVVTVVCIFGPLVAVPFDVTNTAGVYALSFGFLFLFIVSLVVIFRYLKSLVNFCD